MHSLYAKSYSNPDQNFLLTPIQMHQTPIQESYANNTNSITHNALELCVKILKFTEISDRMRCCADCKTGLELWDVGDVVHSRLAELRNAIGRRGGLNIVVIARLEAQMLHLEA